VPLTYRSKIDNFLGEFAYPIYITHILALRISTTLADMLVLEGNWLRFTFHFTIIMIVGIASFYLFVRPIEIWRGRRTMQEKYKSV